MSLLLKRSSLPLAPFTLEVDLEVRCRVMALFGPSGSGKTSLLDLVAGLRRARSAFIQLDERVLTDTAGGRFVPARRRAIGYVPQDLALFPHFSVRQNLAYGQRAAAAGDGLFAFAHVIEVLDLGPLLHRSVADLSGGEKQRVAFGRALLTAPRLLLLDEPLASLDAKLKSRILPYLARIRDEFHLPMLYVTHDRFETLSLADEMAVMIGGKIVQTGPVPEVFGRPASLAVAAIVAVETVQPARVVDRTGDLIRVALGEIHLTAAAQELPSEALEVFVCIRAEEVILMKGEGVHASPRNHLPAVIRSLAAEGPLVRIDLDCGFPLVALLTKQACEELALQPGDRVFALVKAPHIHLIPR